MDTEKKGFVLTWISLALIIVCPALFSLPAIWDFLDLSEKGPIGDAIGGMTAPILGLASVILLYWTLREQVRINLEQRRFNDISRILSMNAQIAQMADSLSFGFSSNRGIMVGHGLSSIQVLDKNLSDVGIAEEEFKQLFEKIQLLDNSTTLLFLTLTNDSLLLEDNERQLMLGNLRVFLEKYSLFYDLVLESRISVMPVLGINNDPLMDYSDRARYLKNQVDKRILDCVIKLEP
jgi:hypothetical protein